MPIGTVKFFNASKGYGFIQPEGGGSDAFVHITAVERSGLPGLNENQRVSYDLEQDRRGKMSAVNLKSPEEAQHAEAIEAEQTDAAETAQQDPSQQDLEESKA
jgi:CspA family cold shock protein